MLLRVSRCVEKITSANLEFKLNFVTCTVSLYLCNISTKFGSPDVTLNAVMLFDTTLHYPKQIYEHNQTHKNNYNQQICAGGP